MEKVGSRMIQTSSRVLAAADPQTALYNLVGGEWIAASAAEKIVVVRDQMTAYGDPDELARWAPPAEPHADLPLFSRRTTGTGDEVHGAVSF